MKVKIIMSVRRGKRTRKSMRIPCVGPVVTTMLAMSSGSAVMLVKSGFMASVSR